MDLSKAVTTINHNLLLIKARPYLHATTLIISIYKKFGKDVEIIKKTSLGTFGVPYNWFLKIIQTRPRKIPLHAYW